MIVGYERQDAADYSGVVRKISETDRIAISPTGGRYLVQRRTASGLFKVVSWATTASRLVERRPAFRDAFVGLPDDPAQAAPETVARRWSEKAALAEEWQSRRVDAARRNSERRKIRRSVARAERSGAFARPLVAPSERD